MADNCTDIITNAVSNVVAEYLSGSQKDERGESETPGSHGCHRELQIEETNQQGTGCQQNKEKDYCGDNLPSTTTKSDNCMSSLLGRLKNDLGELREQGDAISKQMWLMYVTFEDFMHLQHPSEAGRLKPPAGAPSSSTDSSLLACSNLGYSNNKISSKSQSFDRSKFNQPESRLSVDSVFTEEDIIYNCSESSGKVQRLPMNRGYDSYYCADMQNKSVISQCQTHQDISLVTDSGVDGEVLGRNLSEMVRDSLQLDSAVSPLEGSCQNKSPRETASPVRLLKHPAYNQPRDGHTSHSTIETMKSKQLARNMDVVTRPSRLSIGADYCHKTSGHLVGQMATISCSRDAGGNYCNKLRLSSSDAEAETDSLRSGYSKHSGSAASVSSGYESDYITRDQEMNNARLKLMSQCDPSRVGDRILPDELYGQNFATPDYNSMYYSQRMAERYADSDYYDEIYRSPRQWNNSCVSPSKESLKEVKKSMKFIIKDLKSPLKDSKVMGQSIHLSPVYENLPEVKKGFKSSPSQPTTPGSLDGSWNGSPYSGYLEMQTPAGPKPNLGSEPLSAFTPYKPQSRLTSHNECHKINHRLFHDDINTPNGKHNSNYYNFVPFKKVLRDNFEVLSPSYVTQDSICSRSNLQSSTRDSTTSVDSGCSSSSSCKELNDFMSPRKDEIHNSTSVSDDYEEHLYEVIPDALVYDRVNDTTSSSSGLPQSPPSDNTYASLESTPVVSRVKPPALPDRNTPAHALTNKSRRVRRARSFVHIDDVVQETDIVDLAAPHLYTVADVLQSFDRLAGHLNTKARDNICSLLGDEDFTDQLSESLEIESQLVADGILPRVDECDQDYWPTKCTPTPPRYEVTSSKFKSTHEKVVPKCLNYTDDSKHKLNQAFHQTGDISATRQSDTFYTSEVGRSRYFEARTLNNSNISTCRMNDTPKLHWNTKRVMRETYC